MTTPEPDGQQSLTYDALHRAGLPGWWRPLAGVTLLAITTYVVAPFFAQACLAVWFALRDN